MAKAYINLEKRWRQSRLTSWDS